MITINSRTTRGILLSFLVITLAFNQLGNTSLNSLKANPVVYWGEHFEQGGILVANQTDYNLSMSFANVNVEIDARKYGEEFHLSFDGIYTIYNPNSTVSVLIGNPFQLDMSAYFYPYWDEWNEYYGTPPYVSLANESLQVSVNNEQIPANLRWMNSTLINEWEEYFGEGFYPQLLVLSNITLRGYSSTNLRYSWNTTLLTSGGSDFSNFYYVVGTGRSWSTNITETVSFKIFGRQPDFYADDYGDIFFKECQVTSFEEGEIYTWKWVNEEILNNVVGVNYDRVNYSEIYRIFIITFVPIIAILTIIGIYFFTRKRFQRRKIK